MSLYQVASPEDAPACALRDRIEGSGRESIDTSDHNGGYQATFAAAIESKPRNEVLNHTRRFWEYNRI
jgi:hypothetical protein